MCSEVHEVNLAGVICDREEVIKGGGFSSLQRQGLEDKPLPPFLLLLLLLGLSEGEWWRTAQDRFASWASPAQGIKPTTAWMTAACQNAGFPQTQQPSELWFLINYKSLAGRIRENSPMQRPVYCEA